MEPTTKTIKFNNYWSRTKIVARKSNFTGYVDTAYTGGRTELTHALIELLPLLCKIDCSIILKKSLYG